MYTDAINTNTPYECVHRIVRPSGEVRVVLERSEDIVDENGESIYSFGLTQDITERKQKEDALLESEKNFELFLNRQVAIA